MFIIIVGLIKNMLVSLDHTVYKIQSTQKFPVCLQAKTSAINLATSAAEVRSYVFLCELQPFLDRRLVESLFNLVKALNSIALPS